MERFVELAPSDTEILAQRPDMSESEKEEFLARFEKKQDPDAKGGLIGFCVMSGTFNDIDVPPTLVSFAVDTAKENDVITPEFKKAGDKLVLVTIPIDAYDLPVYDEVME